MRLTPLPLLTAALLLSSAFVLRADDVKEITLHTDPVNPLGYAKESKSFTVKAGDKVKVNLENKSPLPHNILIVKPGALQKVGALANGMLTDPNAMAKDYIPESPDILFHTKLIQPTKVGTLEFTAPAEPGDYPYLCTFPGHWMLMQGIMKVEK